MNLQSHQQWVKDNGDYAHNLNHDLNENSIVMDLGGYTGVWAQQIIDKYNSNIYVIEPVKEFYDILVKKFKDNPKVHLLNVGISTEDKMGFICFDGDATSSNIKGDKSIEVEFNTLETIMNKFQINHIDLLQINIEGDEYDLMEYLQNNPKILKSVKKYQIQFHTNVENFLHRRNWIQQNFINNGYENNFDYPFVWESWSLNSLDQYIHNDVEIKQPCVLGDHIAIDKGFYCTTQLEVGNYVHIGPYVTCIGGKNTKLTLKGFNNIMAGARIICGSDRFDDSGLFGAMIPDELKGKQIIEPIVMEEFSNVGTNAIVLPGSRLRKGVLLTAGSLLMGDTEEWGVYKGNPAVLVKKIDPTKILEAAKKLS